MLKLLDLSFSFPKYLYQQTIRWPLSQMFDPKLLVLLMSIRNIDFIILHFQVFLPENQSNIA